MKAHTIYFEDELFIKVMDDASKENRSFTAQVTHLLAENYDFQEQLIADLEQKKREEND